MEKVSFPINNIPYQNVDPIALEYFNDSLFDGYMKQVENRFVTIKRPGSEHLITLGTNDQIDGAYWWENRQVWIAVSGGQVFKISNEFGTKTNLTGDKLNENQRPTFADNGDILVIANGGRMVFTDGTSLTAYITDIDAPTQVTHVAFLDQYLIVNEVGTGRFRFADFINVPTVWYAIDVFTAEANPDNIIALYVNSRIIHIFGTQSIEFWYDDGLNPFSRLQGTTTQRGAMSPYSIVNVNEILYFIDDKRRLNRLIGQTPEIISTSFDKTIQNFRIVSDTICDYITQDGNHFILFTFPEEDKSLLYDIAGNYWAQWSHFDELLQIRKRYLGNCYCYARAFNQHIIGSYKSDKIYLIKSDVYSDDGEQIRFEKTTGWIDYGQPDNKKISYKLTLRLKTGIGIGNGGNTEPFMRIRWRDTGNSVWSNFRTIGLNISGIRDFKVTTRNLGSYYARQWNIQMFEDVPFVIGSCIEGVDINDF